MNALVKKEIRLLLPAWVAALLLIVASMLLSRNMEDSGLTAALIGCGVAIGSVVLGLSAFGREFSPPTFSLLLTQPRPRERLWRAKIGVLLASLSPLAMVLGLVPHGSIDPAAHLGIAIGWFVTACVAITGGLWTTLLFRQIIAAFWISALLPLGIFVSVMTVPEAAVEERSRSVIATVLLFVYSVAGYLFAHWQFRHAQDTAWTGGNVSLPDAARWWPWKRTTTARPKTHPLRALLARLPLFGVG